MNVDKYEEIVEPKQGVQISLDNRTVIVKGPKGELKREFKESKIFLEIKEGKLIIFAKKASKREKRLCSTIKAHINNMCKGVSVGHEYKLKICSGHFPMNVAIIGDKLVVKNFLGEAMPRTITLKKGADVKIQGDFITITSISKETASQIAADIEQMTRITNRDKRIFQDGIYIISKDGKEV